MKVEVGSFKHITELIELFFLLHIFHDYSKQRNFYYSVKAGSILSHHKINTLLPWDDDIDVVVPFSQFSHISQLWENATGPARNIWDHNWSYKTLTLNSYDIIILTRRTFKMLYLKFI